MTSNGQSTLTLASQTAGSNGTLTVNSSIVATSDTPLSYTGNNNYTNTTADSGTLTKIPNASDALTGSISIQVGNGAAQTDQRADFSETTRSPAWPTAINSASIGVTASVVRTATGRRACR